MSWVTQKNTSNLHLAAKMWWISITSQLHDACFSPESGWQLPNWEEIWKEDPIPSKADYEFIFKSYAFNMFYPADLSFLVSKLPCYSCIFFEKESCRDADLLLQFCCSPCKEKILKVISWCVDWLVVLPSQFWGFFIRFSRVTNV